ncbi:MAG: hypothetical protein JWP82_991, partial [Humibacillus sp.]|nr:hypothetical protein [Humibacillus sp.]
RIVQAYAEEGVTIVPVLGVGGDSGESGDEGCEGPAGQALDLAAWVMEVRAAVQRRLTD